MGAATVDDAVEWMCSLEGEGNCFGVLFDRHRDRVFRLACRLVDKRRDAEDVTATAFLELWRRRRDVRLVDGSVLPWLLVTTSNVARNVGRATRHYRALLDRLPREVTAPDATDGMGGAQVRTVRKEPARFDRSLAETAKSARGQHVRLVARTTDHEAVVVFGAELRALATERAELEEPWRQLVETS